jgi:uncharacterized protein involved in outer membrane biogenesis
MRWFKVIGIAFLFVALLVVVGVVYVTTADLSRFKHTVEQAVFEATGRKLTIAGRFEPDIGFTSSLIATDIDFANSDWSEEPAMVHVDHLAVSVNLLSLIRQPVVVSNFELRGGRIRLEVDDEGRQNWPHGIAEEADKRSKRTQLVPVVFPKVDLRDIEITYRDRPDARKLTLVIDQISERPDETGLLNIDIRGRLNERSIEIAGYIGPISNLLSGKDVRQKLSGRIGNLNLELEGQIGEIATLQQPDLRLELHADELSQVSEMLGLGSMGEGSLNARGRLSPAPEGVSMEYSVDLGAIQASVAGTADALINTEVLDMSVEASGPNLAPLNVIIKGLPQGAFNLAGRLQKRNATYRFEQVEAKIGDNEARLYGTLGDLPRLTGTSLEFKASGPDLSVFSNLVEIPLAPEPYVAEGRLDWEAGALKLTGVHADIGENRLALDGVLGPPHELIGTRLQIRAQGPDFSSIPLVATHTGAPAQAFDIKGQLNITPGRYEIDALHATVGEFDLRASGIVGMLPGLKGTDLEFEAGGPDLSRLTPYARVDGLPAAPYSVSGRVRSRKSRFRLDGLVAEVGPARLELEGEVGSSSGLVGTAIRFHSSIPNLAVFEPVVAGVRLPGERFESSGLVRVSKAGYELEEIKAQLGNVTARAEGIVGRSSDLSGTNLEFDASAPNLALLAPYVKDVALPQRSFSAAGRFRLSEEGYEFTETTAKLGDAELRIDGTIGQLSKLTNTDVTIVATGPNFAEIAAVMNLDAPQAPFRIAARTERFQKGLRFREASAKVGEYQLELSGFLGEPPTLADTKLNFSASGPDLRLVSQLAGLDRSLSGDPFEISGRFDGTPEEFRLEDLIARLGESDLSGSLGLDLRKKPALNGELSSKYLELDQLLEDEPSKSTGEKAVSKTKSAEPPPGAKQASTGTTQYRIPDTPLDLSGLDAVDLNIRFTAGEVQTDVALFPNVEVSVRLRDGRLELDPISARDEVRGSVSATVMLEPKGDGYGVSINGSTEKLRLGLLSAKDKDPANQPPLDIKVVFEGRGSSLHRIAASGNGTIEVVLGGGRIDNSALSLLLTDLTLQVLNALNPFRKSETYTLVECGVVGVKIVDGVATLNPIAGRAEKITVVGSGRIDLKSERIDLAWNTRPREGLGISASAITNPFVRLGGTLSSPIIGLKPTEAALSTGAAVATGGLSILAKGLLDRLRAEEDVCKAALAELRGGPTKETLIEKLLR